MSFNLILAELAFLPNANPGWLAIDLIDEIINFDLAPRNVPEQ